VLPEVVAHHAAARRGVHGRSPPAPPAAASRTRRRTASPARSPSARGRASPAGCPSSATAGTPSGLGRERAEVRLVPGASQSSHANRSSNVSARTGGGSVARDPWNKISVGILRHMTPWADSQMRRRLQVRRARRTPPCTRAASTCTRTAGGSDDVRAAVADLARHLHEEQRGVQVRLLKMVAARLRGNS
jgi:hypothetical protein